GTEAFAPTRGGKLDQAEQLDKWRPQRERFDEVRAAQQDVAEPLRRAGGSLNRPAWSLHDSAWSVDAQVRQSASDGPGTDLHLGNHRNIADVGRARRAVRSCAVVIPQAHFEFRIPRIAGPGLRGEPSDARMAATTGSHHRASIPSLLRHRANDHKRTGFPRRGSLYETQDEPCEPWAGRSLHSAGSSASDVALCIAASVAGFGRGA